MTDFKDEPGVQVLHKYYCTALGKKKKKVIYPRNERSSFACVQPLWVLMLTWFSPPVAGSPPPLCKPIVKVTPTLHLLEKKQH